jgi:transcriptional regulator with XRE-family HTH domain
MRMRANDTTIGQRIKDRRTLLGRSMRHCASRADISVSTWSRIESGLLPADNRFMLARIAAALDTSVAELTGNAVGPADEESAQAYSAVNELVRAAMEADLDYEPTVPADKPLAALLADVALARSLMVRCDFKGEARVLAPTMRGLHAIASGSRKAADRRAALRGLVLAHEAGVGCARYGAGQVAAAGIMAERGKQAAQLLGDPTMTAMASWGQAHAALACSLYERALGIVTRAADELGRSGDGLGSMEMLGALHLSAAYALHGLGRLDDALVYIAEARRIADRTGDSTELELYFGPTNVGIWHVSMTADGGDPGEAIAAAAQLNPTLIDAVHRQTAFYLDTGRALARVGRDDQAVRQFVTAERIAPQWVHADPLVAEALRALLDRSRRNATGSQLRGLCERMGIGV